MSKVIEDYQLQQKIGSGQYGNVYRADHKRTKGQFAVKVMNVDKFKQTPKLTEFTNNEINILSKISHPNIIRFVEMLRTNNNYYLVYDYCNGGTLAEHIKKKGRLSEEESIHIFEQLRTAFEVLFESHILHRDLKPTNILFHNGVVKLADFGFCKELLKENDMTQTMVGSPIYMAPEVLKGLIYDARADIWSLGIILYEMLFGICPYEESSIPKLISLIDNHLIKFPPDVHISENMKNLLKRTLTIKYRDRISAPEFIKYDLKKVVEEPESKEVAGITARDAAKYIRRALIYLTESLEVLAGLSEDIVYLRLTYLVHKVILSIFRDTMRGGTYWQNLGLNLSNDKWDDILTQEMLILRPLGEFIKEALTKEDTSLKMKVEFDTLYVDSKFFLESMRKIDENQMRVRLLNCFLYSRHFSLIMEKRGAEWSDPASDTLSVREKEEICYKYARYY